MVKDTKTCKTLILCGGKGKRMGKIGESIPKALVELHGRPILYHKLKKSVGQGFADMVIAIGYKGDMIIDACKKMDLEFKIDFSDSGKNVGMLCRIYEAREMFDDRVIVTYGDSIADLQLADLMDFHLKKESLLTIVSAPIQSPFGLVKSNHDHQVVTIEEKPVLNYYIGTFIMEKKALEFIPKEIINWPDGTGLIAFFKTLVGVNKIYTYIYDGPGVTFNTVEELDAAKDEFLKFHTHFR
ncbi:MAG: sugar phosphate nucleotidyltransferase [Candidatus Orphnella occulta]|nr:sugar phosphate nucleotidyltransferase [Candidatus Orphnella occulta]